MERVKSKFITLSTSIISKNTISQFLVKLATSFSGLLVIFLISYFLGFKTFGSYSKVVAFVSFFYLIIDFGINSIFLRDYFHEVKEKILLLIFLRLFIAVILFIGMAIITYFLPYNTLLNTGFSPIEKVGIIIFGLTIFSQAITVSLTSLFQKRLSYKYTVLPTAVSSFALIIFVCYSIYLKSILLIFASYVTSGALVMILLALSLKDVYKSRLQINNFISFSKKLTAASLPLGLMLFFNLVYAKADTLILSFMRPTVEVGIYGFSYKFFEFAIAIPTFFSNSAYPILIEAEKDKNEFITKIKKYSIALIIISVVIMLVFMLFSPILGFVKKDFAPSILPIQILSLSLPFFFLTSLLQWVLVLKKKMNYLLFVYIFSLILNIFLNLIFIPMFSYIASSVITVVCEGVVAVMLIGYLALYKTKIFRM